MNKTDLIKGIAKELAYGEINAVATENDYEDLAEIIVNKFFLHDVNQQRELLIALADDFNDSTATYVGQERIENVLKAFNCG